MNTRIIFHHINYNTDENGAWKDIVSGTICGPNKIHQFDAVQSTKCRLIIVDAKQAPSIKEIKIYTN
tara:strand:+ start:4044 stop:4244 length:201 start_codon:yes stop_codon:yes gene_type:complete